MDREEQLKGDPGEMYRGFRMRCKKFDDLKAQLIIYVADTTAVTDEAKAAFRADIVSWEQSWSASEEEARQSYFERKRGLIDYLYLPRGISRG